jgi:hypothetical protein
MAVMAGWQAGWVVADRDVDDIVHGTAFINKSSRPSAPETEKAASRIL